MTDGSENSMLAQLRYPLFTVTRTEAAVQYDYPTTMKDGGAQTQPDSLILVPNGIFVGSGGAFCMQQTK
jgi:hypothetical protein